MYFGAGLVKTVEDFGSQGEWPSNPELLDWLATEFMDHGWDMKALQKTIVTSATYRQSSVATPDLLQKDPENRMLARGPRVRLSAEMMRDQAWRSRVCWSRRWVDLRSSRISRQDFGRSYRAETTTNRIMATALHRRSLYTFWKRTAPPPMMMNFDAAGRETCVVRELRTNTPLQSLNLMNDVTFLEAARKMAERMMREGGSTPAERIGYGFELATARRPGKQESEILLDSFQYYRDLFQSDATSAQKYLAQGEAPRDREVGRSRTGRLCVAGQPHFESGFVIDKELTCWSEQQVSDTTAFLRKGQHRPGHRGAVWLAPRGFESGRQRRTAGTAPLSAYGEARDLPLPVRRAVADGSVRLQAAAAGIRAAGTAGLGADGSAADGHDVRPVEFSRGAFGFPVSPARRFGSVDQRTDAASDARSSTMSASSSRCTRRRSITIPR